jgi:hypothetical protein|tara:strand:+ start:11620 stop:11934 length:315 start_codon:yes stop_codon:yes gene_type:complete
MKMFEQERDKIGTILNTQTAEEGNNLIERHYGTEEEMVEVLRQLSDSAQGCGIVKNRELRVRMDNALHGGDITKFMKLFERLGADECREFSDNFYDRIFDKFHL